MVFFYVRNTKDLGRFLVIISINFFLGAPIDQNVLRLIEIITIMPMGHLILVINLGQTRSLRIVYLIYYEISITP